VQGAGVDVAQVQLLELHCDLARRTRCLAGLMIVIEALRVVLVEPAQLGLESLDLLLRLGQLGAGGVGLGTGAFGLLLTRRQLGQYVGLSLSWTVGFLGLFGLFKGAGRGDRRSSCT
jgi:hypothetical protein